MIWKLESKVISARNDNNKEWFELEVNKTNSLEPKLIQTKNYLNLKWYELEVSKP